MPDENVAQHANELPGKPDSDATCSPVSYIPHPQGNWQNPEPPALDEDRMRAIVQHLVRSKSINSAKSCCQCALEEQNKGGSPKYVPVIMMPINPSDLCPFGGVCGMPDSMKEPQSEKEAVPTQRPRLHDPSEPRFLMQRLTDMDLLSQW